MPTNLRIADCVYYGMNSFNTERQSWRITHFIKKVYESNMPPVLTETDEPDFMTALINKMVKEEKAKRKEQGLPHTKRYKYFYCIQSEATHVSLAGICGAIAPIEECEFIREVQWSKEMIEEERQNNISSFWLDNCNKRASWNWE